ncbi:hypothetical protein KVT40_004696 [Elsinoe batatas]|uniref:RNI-like protein n=1 Tax=Elsinoe batatas TaxID=2601811 RepID=A0A8K0L2X0_9PEZI|nr:hypothetical protein KVT40_004696 [Elsinoe batatas]
MESVHGVDVSWLHRPQKDGLTRSRAPSSPAAPPKDFPSPSPRISQSPAVDKSSSENDEIKPLSRVVTEPLPHKTSATIPLGTTTTHIESSAPRSAPRRPGLLGRTSTDRLNGENGKSPRRGSWITNISSRFSSQSQPNTAAPATPQVSKPTVNGTHMATPQPDLEKVATPTSPTLNRKEPEEMLPYVPQKPKESTGNFFSSLTRRLSTNSQTGTPVKAPEHGGVCPRRTMNVNANRPRCLVPELDQAKLRRVSFSVDVEIAGGPRYKDEEVPTDKAKKTKDKKIKERAEGEALKRPQAATDLKEDEASKDASVDEELATNSPDEKKDDEAQDDKIEPKQMTRKQEKKKRSEEERKERKEKKRRKAEENGQIPVELTRDDSDSKDSSPTASVSGATPVPPPKPHDRPTTDPVRIYRRCCQLRESPILKRITEQLMNPKCTVPGDSGTVQVLNLTGSRLQLGDFITLGDWLAIVPVKRLLLEDADITDEGLRVVLAGLLAAKKPEPTRARHRNSDVPKPSPRAGVVERLNLKNNPRVTRSGWKHLALFLNMCKSLKAIDLSMIQFPDDLPPGAQKLSPRPDNANPLPDAAEIFAKALAERQGGSVLEELILSECGLDSEQIRKIVDGAMVCGVSRLGLAGSHLDDDGFEHILTYVRSGICHAVDIGSNDLRGKMDKLAQSLTHRPDCPVWGMSLASCNLDSDSLKPLFQAFTKLTNFRFLDLSHNKSLFENDTTGGVHLLRKYIPQFKELKRIHLNDVGMNAKQAIAIAEVLPEGLSLAHVAILENSELSKLVANTDEASQEEACALYASLMAAVRVSHTIICIDIDVPPPNNSEVVKALAKQVIAYCLRNMERMPLPSSLSSEAASSLSAPLAHMSSETSPRPESSTEITVPDVLIHLVGHVDGFNENHDNDDPAPDSDYIVGGTGVVKALQYCLGEKAQELRRGSGNLTSTPPPGRTSGSSTPRDRPGTSDGADKDAMVGAALSQRQGRAKEVSKNLLGSARKIRSRLQPALAKEAQTGDTLAYRRLVFLDQTLQGMIQRFEDEYPECRLAPPDATSPTPGSGKEGSISSFGSTVESPLLNRTSTEIGTSSAIADADGDTDDELGVRRPSRRGSEVSLASKALAIEEGRMHRIGHGIRQDLAHNGSASPSPGPSRPSTSTSASASGTSSPYPHQPSPLPLASPPGQDQNQDERDDPAEVFEGIDKHLKELTRRQDGSSGDDVRKMVEGSGGWDGVMEKIGANIEELREMKRRDPEQWEGFVESQVKARMNTGADRAAE